MVKSNVDLTFRVVGVKEANRYLLTMSNTLHVVNSRLKNIESQQGRLNARTAQSTKTTGMFSNKMAGLALRFVGYNLILNQVMGAQQKLIQWVTESITKFRTFEKTMAEVGTILLDVDKNSVIKMTKDVERLSITFGKSADDLGKGLYHILSAAVDSSKAIDLLATASKAAIAGLSTVETAVDILTTVINSYGYQVEQAGYISDILFQTVRRGKLTFDSLANAMGYVTPIASQAGVAFEELSAALATATRHGLHIDMTSRGLALAIQNIIKPSEGAKKVAEEYGIQLTEAALRAKGLQRFLGDLGDAIGHNATVLSQIIPNMRSLRVAMVLAGDASDEFADDVELMGAALGRTDIAFIKMTDTAQYHADVIKQTMEMVDRYVGSVTSDFELGYQKITLWWKAFLSGKDAGKILAKLNEQIKDINANIAELRGTEFKDAIGYVEDTTTLFKEMKNVSKSGEFGVIPDLGKAAEEAKPFLKLATETLAVNEELNELYKKRAALPEGMKVSVGSAAMSTYAKASEQVVAASDQLNLAITAAEEKYDTVAKATLAAKGSYDYFVSAIYEAEQAIEQNVQTIQSLKTEIAKLETEVVTSYKGFEGMLNWQLAVAEQEKVVADNSRGVALALMDESYAYLITNETLKTHVKTIRDYKAAQELAKEETDALTLAMQRNNLATLEIQLQGMQRRRGLNRTEKKQLKELQISSSELRIEQLNMDIKTAVAGGSARYNEAQHSINLILSAEKESLFQLKDTRALDIESLRSTIDAKKSYLFNTDDGYYALLEKEERDMIANQIIHNQVLLTLQTTFGTEYMSKMEQIYGLDLPAEIQKSISKTKELYMWQNLTLNRNFGLGTLFAQGTAIDTAIRTWLMSSVPNYQTGTHRVPKTGLAVVDEGETITPAGGSPRGGGFPATIHVDPMSISVSIYDHTGVEEVIQKVELGIQSGLIKGVETVYG